MDPEKRHYFARVPLEALRDAAFDSTMESLLAARPEQLLAGLHVRFMSRREGGDGHADAVDVEAGVDSGGLTREYLELVMRQLVDDSTTAGSPRSRCPGNSTRPRYHRAASVPGLGQPMFGEQEDHSLALIPSSRPPAVYFALGRFIATALVHASYGDAALPFPLDDCLLKHLVGQPITAVDVRIRDPVYFRHRIQELLKPGGIEAVASALCLDSLTFVEDDRELVPAGTSRAVTAENVEEYIELLSEEHICGSVRTELSEFLAGFHGVVPRALLSSCGITFAFLGVLLGGVPELDIRAWRRHADVQPHGVNEATAKSVATWFWTTLEAWPHEERSALLAFATGCSRLPAVGFERLNPPFTVTVVPCTGQLPTAHTCFNALTLPAYRSADELASKLALAVHEGAAGFSLL